MAPGARPLLPLRTFPSKRKMRSLRSKLREANEELHNLQRLSKRSKMRWRSLWHLGQLKVISKSLFSIFFQAFLIFFEAFWKVRMSTKMVVPGMAAPQIPASGEEAEKAARKIFEDMFEALRSR